MQPLNGPFIVRAHHSLQLWRMEYLGYEPEQVAMNIGRIRQNAPERYAHDVMGKTQEENNLALQGITTFLRTFHELPQNQIVQFSALDKDSLCKSCIIGDHCNIVNVALQGEAEWLRGLRTTADVLGLTSTIQVIQAPMLSTWLKRPIPLEVSTTARTARLLVSDRLLPVRTSTSPLDYLKKRALIWSEESMREMQTA